jgi:hypothetical protein
MQTEITSAEVDRSAVTFALSGSKTRVSLLQCLSLILSLTSP